MQARGRAQRGYAGRRGGTAWEVARGAKRFPLEFAFLVGRGSCCFYPEFPARGSVAPREQLLSICRPGPRPGSVKYQHPKSPNYFSKPFGSVRSQNPAALRSAGIFFRNAKQPSRGSAPLLSCSPLPHYYKNNFLVAPCPAVPGGPRRDPEARHGRARMAREVGLAPARGILWKPVAFRRFPLIMRARAGLLIHRGGSLVDEDGSFPSSPSWGAAPS